MLQTQLAVLVVINEKISKSTKSSGKIYRRKQRSMFDEHEERRNDVSEYISLLFVTCLVTNMRESRGEIARLFVVSFQV